MEQQAKDYAEIRDEPATIVLVWSIIFGSGLAFGVFIIGLWTIGGWILEAFK